jgi:SAM-dependent methyltransferase
MDMWKFYDITHREHVVCNPTSEEKLTRLVELVRLPTDAQVVDIACGKGEFLIRLAETYGARGVGIDISPFFIAEAKRRIEMRTSGVDVTFLQMDGADFKPDEPEKLDLASCIGASWVFGGHAATLEALIRMVKPGGWVIVGEPYWRHEPEREYLEAIRVTRNDFGTHYQNVEVGREHGLEAVYTLVSSQDDWDRYEGLQWYAAETWASDHRDDPDVETVLKQVRESKTAYLRWGRETLGWAIYVFKKGVKGVYSAFPVG